MSSPAADPPLAAASPQVGLGRAWSRIWLRGLLITAACVGLSLLIVIVGLPLLGGKVDASAWVLATVCPLVMAFPISTYLLLQNENLRRARDEVASLHRELVGAHCELERRARRDGMTDLLNRETFLREVAGRDRDTRCGALLILDIDHFKQVNDGFGHPSGDAALIAVAGALRGLLRKHDLCGRIGGEEFAVYLPDVAATEARGIAERLRAAVAACDVKAEDGTPMRLTVSIGGAFRADGQDVSKLVSQADHYLYQAKRSGRNRVALPS